MRASIQHSGSSCEPQNGEQETPNDEGRDEEVIPFDILHSLFDIRYWFPIHIVRLQKEEISG